jgi:hypothetical protein
MEALSVEDISAEVRAEAIARNRRLTRPGRRASLEAPSTSAPFRLKPSQPRRLPRGAGTVCEMRNPAQANIEREENLGMSGSPLAEVIGPENIWSRRSAEYRQRVRAKRERARLEDAAARGRSDGVIYVARRSKYRRQERPNALPWSELRRAQQERQEIG